MLGGRKEAGVLHWGKERGRGAALGGMEAALSGRVDSRPRLLPLKAQVTTRPLKAARPQHLACCC